MRRSRWQTAAVVGLVLAAGRCFGQTTAPAGGGNQRAADLGIADRPNQVRGDEITPQQQLAVQKGLAWLASRQQADGSFGVGGGGYGATSGITALSGIAFMSAGNLPGRGKYGDNVDRAVKYLTKSAQESGLLASEASHGVMYSHGFATLFLGEVYGMTGDEVVKEKLQRAVRLIERCQNREGGWRYMPVPYDADISVTIAEVMALRAARDAGIKVEKETIDKAIAYVRKCQNPDGGFSYMANFGGGGGSAFERSAAGVAALYYAGVFEGDDIRRGLDYIQQFQPGKGAGGRGFSHYYYGQYYAVQAMFLAGGDRWSKWYPAIREELLAKQDRMNGNWTGGEVSEEYCTAVALIVLQMPNRYLPVFSGKGPGS
jgi:prenyltransferase beta subunit